MTASLNHRGSLAAACLRRTFVERATLIGAQHDRCQRRQAHFEGVREPVRGNVARVHPTEIAQTAAAIVGRVAVESLVPAATAWYPDAVALARHRSEIAGH